MLLNTEGFYNSWLLKALDPRAKLTKGDPAIVSQVLQPYLIMYMVIILWYHIYVFLYLATWMNFKFGAIFGSTVSKSESQDICRPVFCVHTNWSYVHIGGPIFPMRWQFRGNGSIFQPLPSVTREPYMGRTCYPLSLPGCFIALSVLVIQPFYDQKEIVGSPVCL